MGVIDTHACVGEKAQCLCVFHKNPGVFQNEIGFFDDFFDKFPIQKLQFWSDGFNHVFLFL